MHVVLTETLMRCTAGIGSEGEVPGDADGEVAPRDKPDSPARARPGEHFGSATDQPLLKPDTQASLATLPRMTTCSFSIMKNGWLLSCKCCPVAGNAGAIEHLRGLVASLESAVGFTNAVAGVMPTLTQLLASSSVADVQVRDGVAQCLFGV